MKCVICKNDTTHKGKVIVTLENNGSIILIKDVPAHICDICKHYILDENISAEVLKKGKEGLLQCAELEIIRLKVV